VRMLMRSLLTSIIEAAYLTLNMLLVVALVVALVAGAIVLAAALFSALCSCAPAPDASIWTLAIDWDQWQGERPDTTRLTDAQLRSGTVALGEGCTLLLKGVFEGDRWAGAAVSRCEDFWYGDRLRPGYILTGPARARR